MCCDSHTVESVCLGLRWASLVAPCCDEMCVIQESSQISALGTHPAPDRHAVRRFPAFHRFRLRTRMLSLGLFNE